MPTKGSSKTRSVVLRHCHEANLRGQYTTVGPDTKFLDVPHLCGCVSTFAPAGITETDDVGEVREVWKQVGFKFNEYFDGS